MKKAFLKKLAFFLVLCAMFPIKADATQQKIDKVQEGINDLKQQEEEAQQISLRKRREAWKEIWQNLIIGWHRQLQS